MSDVALAQPGLSQFQLTTSGGPLVPVPNAPVLTLARLQAGVDALQSAEIRAKTALDNATKCLGKDASTRLTRFVGSNWFWPAAIGAGVVTALASYYVVGPNAAEYVRPRYYDQPWLHKVSGHRWGLDLGLALGGSLLLGTCVALGGALAGKLRTKATKESFARGTLYDEQLVDFAQLVKAANERPLERAAIGRVARDTIPSLAAREIYASDAAEAILKSAAADADLGDAAAQAEATRHRDLIMAVRALEAGKEDPTAKVSVISETFSALTTDERSAIANDLRERLFAGKVPRRKDVPFRVAQRLYQDLTP